MTVNNEPHHTIQSHRLYDTIHVGTNEVLVAANIYARIRTITLSSAVLLVNHHELAESRVCRFQHALDRLRRHLHRNVIRHLHHAELLNKQFHRAVSTCIVYNDYLIVGIVYLHQRIYIIDDGDFLVEGRRYYRHARSQWRAFHQIFQRLVRRHVYLRLSLRPVTLHNEKQVTQQYRDRIPKDDITECIV